MANYKVVDADELDAGLTTIADAIRAQTGGVELLSLEEMAGSIGSIKNADEYLADVVDKRVVELVNDRITSKLPSGFQNGNNNLVKVDLPFVTELGDSTFSNCPNLSSVNLPSVTKMAAGNFGTSPKLKKLCLPELTTWTGWGYSFNNDYSLETAIFPKLVSQIGTAEFYGCKSLIVLVLGANTVCPLTATNTFGNTPIANGTGYIYVPRAQVSSYQSATNWSAYASQFRAIEDYPGIMEV